MFCMSASTVFLTLNCNFTPLRTNGISSSILLLLSYIFIQQKSEGAKAPPAPPPARSLLVQSTLQHSSYSTLFFGKHYNQLIRFQASSPIWGLKRAAKGSGQSPSRRAKPKSTLRKTMVAVQFTTITLQTQHNQ